MGGSLEAFKLFNSIGNGSGRSSSASKEPQIASPMRAPVRAAHEPTELEPEAGSQAFATAADAEAGVVGLEEVQSDGKGLSKGSMETETEGFVTVADAEAGTSLVDVLPQRPTERVGA
jgi:hypothetical protein